MYDHNEHHEFRRQVMQWIVSLAASVACCALFFFLFAGPSIARLDKMVDKIDNRVAGLEAVAASTPAK